MCLTEVITIASLRFAKMLVPGAYCVQITLCALEVNVTQCKDSEEEFATIALKCILSCSLVNIFWIALVSFYYRYISLC